MIFYIVFFNIFFVVSYLYISRNRLNYLHFSFLIFITHNIIRPIAIYNYGESIIYDKLNLSNYPLALFISSIFFVTFILGFEFVCSKKMYIASFNKDEGYKKISNFDYFNIFICILIIAFLFKNFGLMFLAFNRLEGISAAFPETRYLYPFALISSALLTARGIILLFKYKTIFTGTFFFIFGSIVTTIINQRGFAISFVFIAFISILNYRIQIKKSSLYFLLLIWFLAFVVRELPAKLFSENESTKKEFVSYSEKIVSSADGDSVEVWVIILQYLEEKGFLYGKSIINNIYNIFYDNKYRLTNGIANGLDILNDYRFGTSYVELKFGFNVSTSQELYINFGIFSLPIIFIMGIILGLIYNKLLKNIYYKSDEIYESLPLFAIINIFSSFAGLQWTVLCLIYFLFYKVTK